MFKPHIGTCTHPSCKRPENARIAIKKGWCDECNYNEKQKNKKLSGKRTGKYIFKRESTGEAELFEEIAAERDWVCFVTGQPLKELKPINFMHVLAKALNKYPKMKLYKPNIQLASDDIHFKWDHTPRSELRKDPLFDKLFKLEEELKEEYKLL